MKKLICMMAFAMMAVSTLFAFDFTKSYEGNQIYFDITSETTCEVVAKPIGEFFRRNVVIPEKVTYRDVEYTVTAVGDAAFERQNEMIKVQLPETIVRIGEDAFLYCSRLQEVNLPNNVTYIGKGAFFGCALTSLEFPKDLTTIAEGTFAAINIESLEIPEGITSIGAGAFLSCKSLKTVKIPDSVETISPGAFSSCPALTSFEGKFASADGKALVIDGVLTAFAPAGIKVYEIPETVTTITSVMSPNYEIEEIIIPNSVTIINNFAFDGCPKLASVTFGNSVETIGTGAFFECFALKEICSLNPVPPVLADESVFYELYPTATLYVPTASIEAYRNAEIWKNFANIKSYEDKVNSIADVVASAEDGDIYSMQGIKVKKRDLNTLPSGIYIHNGKKILVK